MGVCVLQVKEVTILFISLPPMIKNQAHGNIGELTKVWRKREHNCTIHQLNNQVNSQEENRKREPYLQAYSQE